MNPMNCIWLRAFCLVAVGTGLGVFSNLKGPERIPWIRGQAATPNQPEKGTENGDVSTQAVSLFSQSTAAILVDARPHEDYELGHIPNAISLDVRKFETEFAKHSEFLTGSGLPIIIYCNGGDCEDSHKLSDQLKNYNLTALIYTGGWKDWSTAGMPIEKGDRP